MRIPVKRSLYDVPGAFQGFWGILAHWLDVEGILQRSWAERLPAVLAASLLLAAFAWFSGIAQQDLAYTPLILLPGLLAAALLSLRR